MPIALPPLQLWQRVVKLMHRANGALLLGVLSSACSPGHSAPAGGPDPKVPGETTSQQLQPMQPEDVAFGLRHKEGDARRCFGELDNEDAPLRGLVRMQWTVAASGEVKDTAIARSTIEHQGVTDCLSRLVSSLKYPRRARPSRARWTFVRGVADASVLQRAEKRQQQLAKGRHVAHEENRFDGAKVDERSLGELTTDRIENVAEAGFRIYAHCLRSGLDRNIKLRGRVLLRFAIGDDGRVLRVVDAGSDLPDLDVIDCLAQGFYALEFPPPRGGIVSVTYPIFLNEGD